jgi:acetyl-CoA carboxylase beta subunit
MCLETGIKVEQYDICNCKNDLAQYHKQCKDILFTNYIKNNYHTCSVCGLDLQYSKDESIKKMFIEQAMKEESIEKWIGYFLILTSCIPFLFFVFSNGRTPL